VGTMVVRGSVGPAYKSAYSHEWRKFKKQSSAYREILGRLNGEEPAFEFSARTGFWVFHASASIWVDLFEQEFLPIVKPLFHHLLRSQEIKEGDVLPFYLALLHFTRSSDGISSRRELTAVLKEEFRTKQTARVIKLLMQLGLLRRLRTGLRVTPVSWLCPPYIDKSENDKMQTPTGGKNQEEQRPSDVPGFHVYYFQGVYALLAESARSCSHLEKCADSHRYRFDCAEGVFPLVHRMIDYYLYDEASRLLDTCRKAFALIDVSEEEATRVRGEFDVLLESSWGFQFREVCSGGDWQRAAVILPLTISYIEDGIFRPLSPRGPYRFLPKTSGST